MNRIGFGRISAALAAIAGATLPTVNRAKVGIATLNEIFFARFSQGFQGSGGKRSDLGGRTPNPCRKGAKWLPKHTMRRGH